MRKMLFALFCLASSAACSSAPKHFDAMDNCVLSLDNGEVFSCVDRVGHPYTVLLMNAKDLVCFKSDQFKVFQETCRQ